MAPQEIVHGHQVRYKNTSKLYISNHNFVQILDKKTVKKIIYKKM